MTFLVGLVRNSLHSDKEEEGIKHGNIVQISLSEKGRSLASFERVEEPLIYAWQLIIMAKAFAVLSGSFLTYPKPPHFGQH